jgi:hypothetical protein
MPYMSALAIGLALLWNSRRSPQVKGRSFISSFVSRAESGSNSHSIHESSGRNPRDPQCGTFGQLILAVSDRAFQGRRMLSADRIVLQLPVRW